MNYHFDLVKHEFEGLTTKCEKTETYNLFRITNHKTMKEFVLKFYFMDSFFALINDNSNDEYNFIALETIFKIKGIPRKKGKFFRKLKGNVYEEIAKYYIGNLIACKEYL